MTTILKGNDSWKRLFCSKPWLWEEEYVELRCWSDFEIKVQVLEVWNYILGCEAIKDSKSSKMTANGRFEMPSRWMHRYLQLLNSIWSTCSLESCYSPNQKLMTSFFQVTRTDHPEVTIHPWKGDLKPPSVGHSEEPGTYLYQWLFLVPLKGGRWHSPSPNWQYIPLIYHLYIAFWGVICCLFAGELDVAVVVTQWWRISHPWLHTSRSCHTKSMKIIMGI